MNVIFEDPPPLSSKNFLNNKGTTLVFYPPPLSRALYYVQLAYFEGCRVYKTWKYVCRPQKTQLLVKRAQKSLIQAIFRPPQEKILVAKKKISKQFFFRPKWLIFDFKQKIFFLKKKIFKKFS